MSAAPRDDNGYPTLIGVSSVDNVTPVAAKADPVTGYILMSVLTTTHTSTNPPKRRDDNAYPVLMGITNDTNQTVKPIVSDPNNPGYVLVDILFI